MEWWGWVAWPVSIVTSSAALWLGVRAELRTRYRKVWSPEWVSGGELVFHNLTGEDAMNVELLQVAADWRQVNYRPYSLVKAGAAAKFAVVPNDYRNRPAFSATLSWRRPSTGKTYTAKIV